MTAINALIRKPCRGRQLRIIQCPSARRRSFVKFGLFRGRPIIIQSRPGRSWYNDTCILIQSKDEQSEGQAWLFS
jgi:hypothetical protein